MRNPEDIKDLISQRCGPWEEFENNFEEGWTGNPLIPTLPNPEHHRHVSNVVANQLNILFESDTDFLNRFQNSDMSDRIMGEYYEMAAMILYPSEPLFWGCMEEAYFKYRKDNNLE